MNAPDSILHYPFPDLPAEGTAVRIAPGVRWVRMPLPFALDHINLWLLDDGDALTAVDSGYGIDRTRDAWNRILEAESRPLGRIVVTHHHPDHVGLAAWLAARDGGRIHMTLGEYLGGQAIWHQLPGYSVADMVAQFRAHGLAEERAAALAHRGNAYRHGIPSMPANFDRLVDGEHLSIDGREWRVIIGYGHAPEHASLYCEALGILISGDMLLPRISTNISVYAATPYDDPLGRFLDSIGEFCELPDDTLVLPSHGKPFKGIRARVDQLVEHHRDRCAALLSECGAPRCAGELLGTLFPRELDTHQSMFAMGEAIAHLNHLEKRSALRRVVGSDELIRYVRTS
ncbi:MBL fold metallo-hydrolase [Thauera sinica]|uniref:MBL fold metallo-hydrolase n=1 Tax=Thauera sinica TaxID=2665146 RepID=A0ABW1ASV3_9RHOO|nr:MBL fold metallo-hydrolase [Thauera sp. K11]ATE61372.1 Zn-dependent hydrolase [Thauera sp. K11]